MTQGVDYDVCGRDTKSEVGQDAAGDNGSVKSKAEDSRTWLVSHMSVGFE
jgi:hypothetical protein